MIGTRSASRRTPGEALALGTFVKLNRAADSLVVRLLARDTLGELTLAQFGVLEALYHLGPMCQNEIGTKVLRSTSHITFVVDNLEKLGLVRRRRATEDRRKVIVSLTPKGEARIAELFPGHAAAITDEMGALSREEQRELGHLCRKLGKGRGGEPTAG